MIINESVWAYFTSDNNGAGSMNELINKKRKLTEKKILALPEVSILLDEMH